MVGGCITVAPNVSFVSLLKQLTKTSSKHEAAHTTGLDQAIGGWKMGVW